MTKGTISIHGIGPSKCFLIIVYCCSVNLISTQSISKNALEELSSSMVRPEVTAKALFWLSTHQKIHGSHERLPITENVANTNGLAGSSLKSLKAGITSYANTLSSIGITDEITVTLKQSLALHSTKNSLPVSSLNSLPPLQSHQRTSTAHVTKGMLSTRSKESTSLIRRRTDQISQTTSTPMYDRSKLLTDQTSERLASIHSTVSTQTFLNGFTSQPAVLLQSYSTVVTDQTVDQRTKQLPLSQSFYSTPNVYQSTLKVVRQSFTPSLRHLTVSTSRVPDRPQQAHSVTHSTESIQNKRKSNPNVTTDSNSQQLKPSPSIKSSQSSRGELPQSSSSSTEGRFKVLTEAPTIELMSSHSQLKLATTPHHKEFNTRHNTSTALSFYFSTLNDSTKTLQTDYVASLTERLQSSRKGRIHGLSVQSLRPLTLPIAQNPSTLQPIHLTKSTQKLQSLTLQSKKHLFMPLLSQSTMPTGSVSGRFQLRNSLTSRPTLRSYILKGTISLSITSSALTTTLKATQYLTAPLLKNLATTTNLFLQEIQQSYSAVESSQRLQSNIPQIRSDFSLPFPSNSAVFSSETSKRRDTRLHEGSTKNVQHSKFRRINRFSTALLVHPSRTLTNPTSKRHQTTQIIQIGQKAHSTSTFKTSQDSLTSTVSPSIVGDHEISFTPLAIAVNHPIISSQRIHRITPSFSTAKPDTPTKFRMLISKGFQLNNVPSLTHVFSSRKEKAIDQTPISLNNLSSLFINNVQPTQSKRLGLSGGSFVLLENPVKEPRQRSFIVSTQTFQQSSLTHTTTFTDHSPNNQQSSTSRKRTKTLEQTTASEANSSLSVIDSNLVGAPNVVPKHTSSQLHQDHLMASSQLTLHSSLRIQISSSPPLFSASFSTTPGLQNPLLPARHQTEFPAFTMPKAVVLELFSTQLEKDRNKWVSFRPTASSLTSSKAIVSTISSISATVNNLKNSNELNRNATNENSTENTKKEKSTSTEGIFVILVTATLPSIVVICMVCCLINNRISKVRERNRVEAVRARQMARKRHSSQASLLSAWNSREFLGHIPAKESKLKETISVDLSWRYENSDTSARNQDDSSLTAYMDGDLSSGNPEGSTTTSERSSVERNQDFDHKNRNMKGNGKNRRTSAASDGLLIGHPSKVEKIEEDIVSSPLHNVSPVTKVRQVVSLSSLPNKLTEGSNRNAVEEFPMLPIEKPHDNAQAQEKENDLHTRQEALKQLNDSIPAVLEPNNLARRKKEFRHQRWQKETPSASEDEGFSNKEESK